MKKQIFGAILFIYLILHTVVPIVAQTQISQKEAMAAIFLKATSFQDFIDSLIIQDTVRSENSWDVSTVISGIKFGKGGSVYDTFTRRYNIEVDGYIISWVPSFGRGGIWAPDDHEFCFCFINKDLQGWRFFLNQETKEKINQVSFGSLVDVLKKLKNFKK